MSTASAMENGIEGLARWSLRLFGGFELSVLPGSERVALPRKRERVLVAYLALSPNGRTSRRKLATLLWGEAGDETALENLRTAIWSLRKALGDAEHRVIASEGEDIVLDATAFEVDVLTFRRLAAQPDRAELEAAAKLYSGELLDGLGIENEEFESWRRTQATRCRDQAIEVVNRLMTQLAELGETERAIEAGLRLLELDPLHEAAARRLMRLYGGSGRRSAAVQLYRSLSDSLKTDLDAQPEAETRAVLAEIARGGEEAPAAPHAKAPPPLPMPRLPSDASREPQPAEHAAPAAGAPQRVGPRRMNTKTLGWVFAGGLAAAMALFLVYQFAPPAGTTTAQQPTGVEAAKAAASSPAGAISIVVLPFNNLSSDTEQEFFSDGVTEEITSALAKIPDLHVVGRTSAYEFKGAGKDLRTIGQALNATHLIEGSVRKAGTRVRITAQLIASGDGTHIWSESYDRELTDVFAIQEDIAKAIAEALKVPLGLSPGESLVSNRRIDPESYQQFLRARTILRNRGGQGQAVENRYAGAIGMLEQVVARDPSYAPAWALLAMMSSDPGKKETAAQEAIRLDSRNAAGYGALAQAQNFRGNFATSEELARRALAVDPNEPEVLDAFSLRIVYIGRINEALSLREKLRTLEPFVPAYNIQYANVLLIEGQNQLAITVLQALPAGAPRNISLAHAYAAEGRYGEGADTLLATPLTDRTVNRQQIEDAARLLRGAPTKVKAPETLPVVQGQLSYVYAYIGALERGLDEPERVIAQGRFLVLPQIRHLWSPEYAPIRKTERFKALMRAAKFVDWWRATRWADRCRPLGANDFVCD